MQAHHSKHNSNTDHVNVLKLVSNSQKDNVSQKSYKNNTNTKKQFTIIKSEQDSALTSRKDFEESKRYK